MNEKKNVHYSLHAFFISHDYSQDTISYGMFDAVRNFLFPPNYTFCSFEMISVSQFLINHEFVSFHFCENIIFSITSTKASNNSKLEA